MTFSLAGRGQRNSDEPFAAMFPGLLTEGIDSKDSYVFRGIVADAIRGLEFISTDCRRGHIVHSSHRQRCGDAGGGA